ncbi:MAG: DUF1501 domain-containing protein, partial [Bacteroidetes Order II. Incertae sedis bacterium]|nr:DUF1501 domain-containing protein [Bacteroidetes Order II. bacterium]
MSNFDDLKYQCSRRHFLSRSSMGFGTAALATMLNPAGILNAFGQGPSADPIGPHFAPKAKRVIYLFQSGGPSHLELLDYKPTLQELNGEEIPASIRGSQRLTGMSAYQKSFPMAGSQFKFSQHGKAGGWFSDLIPHTASIADELCVIRSMHT